MPLSRGGFLEKDGIICIIFLNMCGIMELFEETCRIMGTILGKCGKNCQEERKIFKSCLTISFRVEEISLYCRNIDMSHQFCKILDSNFSDMGGIMGHKFEPKWHVPV